MSFPNILRPWPMIWLIFLHYISFFMKINMVLSFHRNEGFYNASSRISLNWCNAIVQSRPVIHRKFREKCHLRCISPRYICFLTEKYNRLLADMRIMRSTLYHFLKFHNGLRCLEEHFDVPANAVNANNLLFRWWAFVIIMSSIVCGCSCYAWAQSLQKCRLSFLSRSIERYPYGGLFV